MNKLSRHGTATGQEWDRGIGKAQWGPKEGTGNIEEGMNHVVESSELLQKRLDKEQWFYLTRVLPDTHGFYRQLSSDHRAPFTS